MRGAPHSRFARAIWAMSSRTSVPTRGRPPRQRPSCLRPKTRLRPCRRHLRTVPGWTMIKEPRQRDHRRDSISQNSRSQGVSRGRRVPDRWSTRTWCCRARCSKTRSQRSRRLRRHPRSHARNIRIDLPDTQMRSQIIMDSPDQVLRNHSRIKTGFAFERPIRYAAGDHKWSSGESRFRQPEILFAVPWVGVLNYRRDRSQCYLGNVGTIRSYKGGEGLPDWNSAVSTGRRGP